MSEPGQEFGQDSGDVGESSCFGIRNGFGCDHQYFHEWLQFEEGTKDPGEAEPWGGSAGGGSGYNTLFKGR